MATSQRKLNPYAGSYVWLKQKKSSGRSPAARRFLDRTELYREAATEFWNSAWFFPCLFVIAGAFLLLKQGIAGALTMTIILCMMLLFCEDILSALFPFLLLFLVTIDNFSDFRVFFRFWWAAVALVGCFVLHLYLYAKPLRKGKSFRGWALVSAATILSGIGVMAGRDYLTVVSLYYSLGLGVGMFALYLVLKSQIVPDGSGKQLRRFAAVLYATGLFTGFVILRYYGEYLGWFLEHLTVGNFSYRNYCSTILLMAMPIPCYFSLKKGKHLAGFLFLYICTILAGSRSGMLFGTLLAALNIVYLFRFDSKRRKQYALAIAILTIPVIAISYQFIGRLFSARLAGGILGDQDAVRFTFLLQALKDFANSPIFGAGLGNRTNRGIFEGVYGSMIWYHNWFAQVLGSMGIVGVLAYGVQLADRLHILKEKWSPETAALSLSFFGIFLMSMTNPGEFCPLPNEFLVMAMFVLIEDSSVKQPEYSVPLLRGVSVGSPAALQSHASRMR